MYRLCSAALLVALLALALSAPTWALAAGADGEPPPPPEKGLEEAGKGVKMDVPEGIFKGSTDLAIWTLVVFALLLFILGRFAWKPMLEGLKRREDNIRASVEEAQRARDEAQQIRAELEQRMARAEEQVQQRLDEGRRAAQRQYDEAVAKARAEIQAERERLHREIEGAKDQALQEIWNRTADLAVAVSSKVLPRHLTADDQRRLVDEALAELPRTGNGHVAATERR
jgi:F-type H+-transporting ATPase subunit b